jgi:hypothetical protein
MVNEAQLRQVVELILGRRVDLAAAPSNVGKYEVSFPIIPLSREVGATMTLA